MIESSQFEIHGSDSQPLVGNLLPGQHRQLLFLTGFLSKRWGTKSRALSQLCQEHGWGFCCFDYRGNGESGGEFQHYTLCDWLEDARRVLQYIVDGPPITLVGSSLGGWLAWILGQECPLIQRLVLLAPAFNMMGKRAQDISPQRRDEWERTGWMPWDDDAVHGPFPLSWKWVEESRALWDHPHTPPRQIPTTILHGLQDEVIHPKGSWKFTEHVLSHDPHFPIELHLEAGDHRFSTPPNLQTLVTLAAATT